MAGPLPDGEIVPDNGLLPNSAAVGASQRTLSAYLHIPFCSHRCGYCDFNTYTSTELRGVTREGYLASLEGEIGFAARVLRNSGVPTRSLSSVFIGGGTPTLMPAASLTKTLAVLRDNFDVQPGAEITVEANPDTLSADYLEQLAVAGVTRLSVGMQSAVPHVLATLERTHNPDNVGVAVEWAKDAGLAVSVDLIYGTPGESLDDWKRSIDVALSYQLDHISAYSLIVEEGTAMARKISRGEIPEPDGDLQADMYEFADDSFSTTGLHWYEISNWARSAATESMHNRAYWTGQDWWGFGPGAHSHIGGVRFWNAKHPAAYGERLANGITPALGREVLSDEERNLEQYLLESRLREGILAAKVEQSIRNDLVNDRLVTLENEGERIVLTRRGRLLADEVARRLTHY